MNAKIEVRYVVGALLAVAVSSIAVPARSATPEQACQKGRYTNAAKYAACELKTIAKNFGNRDRVAAQRCSFTYFNDRWIRLSAQASGTGSTCDQPRFVEVGGTMIDNATGLQWELKTDDGGLHDRDDVYTWTDSGDADLTNADGTVWSFLASLNTTGSCFAGHCDWRLPTRAELVTIDGVHFNPEVFFAVYWSSSTTANDPESAWYIDDGFGPPDAKKVNAFQVRAVRGGL